MELFLCFPYIYMYDIVLHYMRTMKKEKRIILRIEDDLHLFLEQKRKLNRTTISHEVRQIILDRFNDERSRK
jgi:hypothetical protein